MHLGIHFASRMRFGVALCAKSSYLLSFRGKLPNQLECSGLKPSWSREFWNISSVVHLVALKLAMARSYSLLAFVFAGKLPKWHQRTGSATFAWTMRATLETNSSLLLACASAWFIANACRSGSRRADLGFAPSAKLAFPLNLQSILRTWCCRSSVTCEACTGLASANIS